MDKKELVALREQVVQLVSSKDKLRAEYDELWDAKETLRKRNIELAGENATMRVEKTTLEAEIDLAVKKHAAEREDLAQERDRLLQENIALAKVNDELTKQMAHLERLLGSQKAALSSEIERLESELAALRERSVSQEVVDDVRAQLRALEARVAEANARMSVTVKEPAEPSDEEKRLREEVVFGFYEDEYPMFAQGYDKGVHELSSPVTADECNAYIGQIIRLRAMLEAARETLVLTIAFYGRDAGTPRERRTMDRMAVEWNTTEQAILEALGPKKQGEMLAKVYGWEKKGESR